MTLIGDTACAIRSSGSQGGAMAFEDYVVVTCILEQTQASSGGNANKNDSDHNTFDDVHIIVHHTRGSIETAVLDFESSRLQRVRAICNDQWKQAKRAYKGDFKSSRTAADGLKYQSWLLSHIMQRN